MVTHYKNFTFYFVLFFIFWPACFLYAEPNENNLKAQLKRAIFNFDEVEPGFYRSGQPPQETYPFLKELGIKTVVNFVDDKDEIRKEAQELGLLKIEFISIPWNGLDQPKDENVQKFLAIARDPSKRPLLVHCLRGAERTGLMVACWRVAEKGWPAKKAYQEMKQHRFLAFWYGHLKKYLYEFAKHSGQTGVESNNILSNSKANLLSFFYRLRKLIPST